MTEKAGIPVYLDEIPRLIADNTNISEGIDEWQPSSRAAFKYCRCIEALRDIESILEDASRSKNNEKKRRKTKFLVLSVYSLASALVDLCNDLVGNPETRKHLSPKQCKEVVKMKDLFLENLPLGKGGILRELRDKVAAHIDSSLSPSEAKELWKKADPAVLGLWLHQAINLMVDLYKLPVYFWYCQCEQEDHARMLFTEPLISTFRIEEGRIVELLGVHMTTSTPSKSSYALVLNVVDLSGWMFKPSDPQIREFYKDEDSNKWASFLRNADSWKSLVEP